MVITLTQYSHTRKLARYGYDEALILDTDGYVSESRREYLYCKERNLITTDLSTCLEGITRDTVISLAKELGICILEKRITRDEVYSAEKHFSQERPPKLLL